MGPSTIFRCPGSDAYPVRHWLLIVGPLCPTTQEREQLRYAALRAHRLAASGWGVIVGDDSASDLEVAMTCEDYRIPLRVCGLGVHPGNNTPRRFYERIVLPGRLYQAEAKRHARWRYMLPLAAAVVVVGVEGVFTRLLRPEPHYFTGRSFRQPSV